jgi:hypothetical protein
VGQAAWPASSFHPPPCRSPEPGDSEAPARPPQNAKTIRTLTDEVNVSQFFENARSIFEAAESASRAGQVPSDLTILIGAEGGIQMVADSDWPLERLLAHRGAQMAYRVGERGGKVRLEGRSGSQTCRLETAHRAREALWGPVFSA